MDELNNIFLEEESDVDEKDVSELKKIETLVNLKLALYCTTLATSLAGLILALKSLGTSPEVEMLQSEASDLEKEIKDLSKQCKSGGIASKVAKAKIAIYEKKIEKISKRCEKLKEKKAKKMLKESGREDMSIYTEEVDSDVIAAGVTALGAIGLIILAVKAQMRELEREKEYFSNPEHFSRLKTELKDAEKEYNDFRRTMSNELDPEKREDPRNIARLNQLRNKVERLRGYVDDLGKEVEKEKEHRLKIVFANESSYQDYLERKVAIYEATLNGEIDPDDASELLESLDEKCCSNKKSEEKKETVKEYLDRKKKEKEEGVEKIKKSFKPIIERSVRKQKNALLKDNAVRFKKLDQELNDKYDL